MTVKLRDDLLDVRVSSTQPRTREASKKEALTVAAPDSTRKYDVIKRTVFAPHQAKFEQAAQNVIRGYEEAKKAEPDPAKRSGYYKHLLQTQADQILSQIEGGEHPQLKPAAQSHIQELIQSERPRKKTTAAMGDQSSPAPSVQKASKLDPSQEDAGSAIKNFKAADQLTQMPQAQIPTSLDRKPAVDGDEVKDRHALVTLAAQNLKHISSSMAQKIQKIAEELDAARKYAADPRSYVEGGAKEDWKQRIGKHIESLQRSMSAIEASTELALTSL